MYFMYVFLNHDKYIRLFQLFIHLLNFTRLFCIFMLNTIYVYYSKTNAWSLGEGDIVSEWLSIQRRLMPILWELLVIRNMLDAPCFHRSIVGMRCLLGYETCLKPVAKTSRLLTITRYINKMQVLKLLGYISLAIGLIVTIVFIFKSVNVTHRPSADK